MTTHRLHSHDWLFERKEGERGRAESVRRSVEESSDGDDGTSRAPVTWRVSRGVRGASGPGPDGRRARSAPESRARAGEIALAAFSKRED